ncbi:hypothetical protein [Streptomyces sp. NPDC056160]|uniref:hypothetical protein n=1 Tax=Streptomyces sp. NPDC056160 TaxID=3345731 RepID=UPI0035DBBFEA
MALGLLQHEPAVPLAQGGVVATQQAGGVLVGQRADLELRQPPGAEARVGVGADSRQQLHPAVGRPAPQEGADRGARLVQPLAVVEHQEQRPL